MKPLNPHLYFDSAATTPLCEAAKKTIIEHMDAWGNQNSQHYAGKHARKMYDQNLQKIADLLGVSVGQIIPTFGGTDANQKVIKTLKKRFSEANIYASTIEHSSVMDEILPPNLFDAEDFNGIRKDPKALCLMKANNETGRIQSIKGLRKKYPQAIILSDWVQSVGKIDMNIWDYADFVTLSAHKFYGPKGAGLIIMKHPEQWREISKESHTKNQTGVAGMAAALEEVMSDGYISHLQGLTDLLESEIIAKIPHTKIIDGYKDRVAGVTSIAFSGVRGSELMAQLSEKEGLSVSTGSACTSNLLSPSRVVLAVEKEIEYQSPIRISLHKYHTQSDIKYLVEILCHYASALRNR